MELSNLNRANQMAEDLAQAQRMLEAASKLPEGDYPTFIDGVDFGRIRIPLGKVTKSEMVLAARAMRDGIVDSLVALGVERPNLD